jgi:hypothetical protein
MRRNVLLPGAAVAMLGAVEVDRKWRALRQQAYSAATGLPVRAPEIVATVGTMSYRRFGATGLKASEVGFGAWAIGGKAYGSVDNSESLRGLARAEELGCNLVDTAMVYGESEVVLGSS